MDSKTVRYLVDCFTPLRYRVVAIMGPGSVGKSFLANQLHGSFLASGLTCAVVDLDSFLLPRETRMKHNWITAHNPTAYDSMNLESSLRNLIINRLPQSIPIHDKRAHGTVSHEVVEPSNVFVVEGCTTFYFEVAKYSTLKVFLWAEPDVQFSNRYDRESKELGYDLKASKKRFAQYWDEYLTFVEPMKAVSDIIIKVESGYQGSIEKRLTDDRSSTANGA